MLNDSKNEHDKVNLHQQKLGQFAVSHQGSLKIVIKLLEQVEDLIRSIGNFNGGKQQLKLIARRCLEKITLTNENALIARQEIINLQEEISIAQKNQIDLQKRIRRAQQNQIDRINKINRIEEEKLIIMEQRTRLKQEIKSLNKEIIQRKQNDQYFESQNYQVERISQQYYSIQQQKTEVIKQLDGYKIKITILEKQLNDANQKIANLKKQLDDANKKIQNTNTQEQANRKLTKERQTRQQRIYNFLWAFIIPLITAIGQCFTSGVYNSIPTIIGVVIHFIILVVLIIQFCCFPPKLNENQPQNVHQTQTLVNTVNINLANENNQNIMDDNMPIKQNLNNQYHFIKKNVWLELW